jgi:hypothetical protein
MIILDLIRLKPGKMFIHCRCRGANLERLPQFGLFSATQEHEVEIASNRGLSNWNELRIIQVGQNMQRIS